MQQQTCRWRGSGTRAAATPVLVPRAPSAARRAPFPAARPSDQQRVHLISSASATATATSTSHHGSGGRGSSDHTFASSPASPADPSTWAPLNGQTAVVVGAGPAGCTLAMYLARAGWRVQVYERRPEPGPAGTSRQRSWVLAMYPRGIRPVRAVAEVPLLAERAYKGLVLKGAQAGAKPLVLERTGVLMDRTLLATSLLGAARDQYGARVSFTFNASLQRIDFGRKSAVFTSCGEEPAAAAAAAAAAGVEGSSGQEGGDGAAGVAAEVRYDMLVGADGSSSTVRSLLAAAFPGEYDTEVLSAGTGCYKSLYGLPPLPEVEAWEPDAATPPELRPRGAFFYVLTGGAKGMMSVCRDIDGCYCGYMAGTADTFEQLRTKEDYLAAIPRVAPQLPAAWLPLVADKLLEAPLSSFPTMRSLSRFWSPGGVVLLGDAAHTVTPALGQGLNSALQDCELLAAELAGVQGPDAVDAALRCFSESRAPQMRALQELELLQGASLTPLKWAPKDPARVLVLLARKWAMLCYSGLALLGTAVATATAARRQKRQKEEAEARGAREQGRGPMGEAAAAGGAAGGEVALDATYVRSPPMYELLRGHLGYREMLARVYGMTALGTACTVGLLCGLGWLVWAAWGAVRL